MNPFTPWVGGALTKTFVGSCPARGCRVRSGGVLVLGQGLDDDSLARWLERDAVDGLDANVDIRSQEGREIVLELALHLRREPRRRYHLERDGGRSGLARLIFPD